MPVAGLHRADLGKLIWERPLTDAANVTVAVVGDGAVGLLGVLSAKQMGAGRIIAMSRHQARQTLAREFGATDIVAERGDHAVARIMELTKGVGADACWSASAPKNQ